MGLDMYLNAKRTISQTGSRYDMRLFKKADINNMPKTIIEETAIGYWRKCYKLDDIIMDIANLDGRDDNCVDFYLEEDDIQEIINRVFDALEDNDIDEWEKDGLKDALVFFKTALDFLRDEKSYSECRQIVYYKWY